MTARNRETDRKKQLKKTNKNKTGTNLKQNEAQSARAEPTHKGVNQRSKYVTQVQLQRPESPTVTLTWHACKYKIRSLHQRYISFCCCTCVTYLER